MYQMGWKSRCLRRGRLCPVPALAGKLPSKRQVTTEIANAGPFYYAEDDHQQYLFKNPHGYCGIGGIGNWRDAAEFVALGCGAVQVCTAAMLHGFRIVEEMKDGLSRWMDSQGYTSLQDFSGRAVGNTTDWKYL